MHILLEIKGGRKGECGKYGLGGESTLPMSLTKYQ
jgi:hypothetical protein